MIHAWDNVSLQKHIENDRIGLARLIELIRAENTPKPDKTEDVNLAYDKFFNPTSRLLTRILPGDIEFNHTALFPSLTRPFVFHCEAFAPVFLPLTQQGIGDFPNPAKLKAHYRSILASPLCLAIFSHLPETLQSFELFFNDPEISEKLRLSRIGLSEKALTGLGSCRKVRDIPRFLFINSAHQNPANFFKRGGHIVLKFWKEFRAAGLRGQLVFRCGRPADSLLRDHGVEPDFIRDEMGKSILWEQGYLANHEMNALLEISDFFLLPSASLHSASILQAMNAGAIPIVTDTIGTSVYVADGENGIILKGMRDAIWFRDEETGILVDNYNHITRSVDDSLARQLWIRVSDLLDRPDAIADLRCRMLERVKRDFPGQEFAGNFWGEVQAIHETGGFKGQDREPYVSGVQQCLLAKEDWARIFESVPQPVRRVYTGDGVILELGGTFLHVAGNPSISLDEFSIFEHYLNTASPKLTLSYTIDKLVDKLLRQDGPRTRPRRSRVRAWLSRRLAPYPRLHSFANYKITQLSRFQRFGTFFAKRAISYLIAQFGEKNEDIELVAQDIDGFNVVRYYHLYIGIPRSEGPFDIKRVRNGGYSAAIGSYSLETTIRKIHQHCCIPKQALGHSTSPNGGKMARSFLRQTLKLLRRFSVM